MAAVNEVLSGTDVSVSFTPTDVISDVIIEGDGVELQAQAPSGSWVTVTTGVGAFSVNTPDSSIIYRFVSTNLSVDTRVYMGP